MLLTLVISGHLIFLWLKLTFAFVFIYLVEKFFFLVCAMNSDSPPFIF